MEKNDNTPVDLKEFAEKKKNERATQTDRTRSRHSCFLHLAQSYREAKGS